MSRTPMSRFTCSTLSAVALAAVILLPDIAAGMGGSQSDTSEPGQAQPAPVWTAEGALADAVVLIDEQKYDDAVAVLEELVAEDPANADALNYLGYTNRKLGHYDTAEDFYLRALAIDGNHIGAREYLGELYLETSDLQGALQQAAVLARLCPQGCEALDELRSLIAQHTN